MFIPPPTDWTKHPLHLAALSVNLAELERLLDAGAGVNHVVPHEGTPLDVAIRRVVSSERINVVRLLIARGAWVEMKGERRFYSPLHEAALIGDCSVAKMLLEHGANVNGRDTQQRTPLHLAIERRGYGMVELLLAAGADVNAVAAISRGVSAAYYPCRGMTPLHYAISKGDFGTVNTLLAAGATTDIPVGENDYGFGGLTTVDLVRVCRAMAEREHTSYLESSDALLAALTGRTAHTKA